MATKNDGLYDQNSLILADHYNIFATGNQLFGLKNNNVANVNTLWGIGSGDKGYGQSTTLTGVSPGNVVTATQWSTMLTRITTMASHSGASLGAMASPTGGDLIAAIGTLETNIGTLDTDRLQATVTGSSNSATASDATGWSLTSTHTIDVSFASGDAIRHFFNAGGYLEVTASRTGGAGSSKELQWDDQIGGGLLGDMGTIQISAHGTLKTGGSGPDGGGTQNIEYSIGYYELDQPGIELFRQFASGSVYTSSKVNVTASVNAPAGVNNDNGNVITVVVEMLDPGVTGDPITGTTAVTVLARYPSTTYLTEPSWGTVAFPVVNVVQA